MATYYFRNTGDVNWGTVTNWSLTDGGGATGAVPTAADDAYFTSNSGNCTVNTSARVCKTLIFSGVGAGNYANTITMTFPITVSGNVTLSATMGISGASGITINATATYTSNGITWPNLLKTFGVITVTLAGTEIVKNFETDAGAANVTVTFNSGTLEITGDFTNRIHIGGSTLIKLTGTGTWNCPSTNSGSVRTKLEIDTLGTITRGVNGYFYGGAELKYTKGTLANSTTFLYFEPTGSCSVISNGVDWGRTYFFGGTTTLSDNMKVTDLEISFNNATVNSSNIDISGNINLNAGGQILSGTTTLTINGTGNQSWTGASGGNRINNPLTINKSTGNLSLNGTVNYGTTTSTLTHTSGNITPGTSQFNTGAGVTYNINGSGFILYNWTPSSGTHTINTGTITVNNNLRFNGNTIFAGSGGWIANDLTDSTINRVIQLQSNATSVYTITGNLSLTGTNAAPIVVQSSDAVNTAKLTLNQGANQTVQFVRATRIDSGAGQTVWDTIGTISNPLVGSINWNSGARPAPFNSIRMG